MAPKDRRVSRREPVSSLLRYAVERSRIMERLDGVYALLPKLGEFLAVAAVTRPGR